MADEVHRYDVLEAEVLEGVKSYLALWYGALHFNALAHDATDPGKKQVYTALAAVQKAELPTLRERLRGYLNTMHNMETVK